VSYEAWSGLYKQTEEYGEQSRQERAEAAFQESDAYEHWPKDVDLTWEEEKKLLERNEVAQIKWTDQWLELNPLIFPTVPPLVRYAFSQTLEDGPFDTVRKKGKTPSTDDPAARSIRVHYAQSLAHFAAFLLAKPERCDARDTENFAQGTIRLFDRLARNLRDQWEPRELNEFTILEPVVKDILSYLDLVQRCREGQTSLLSRIQSK
jgi:hypothetical protein